MKLSRLRWLCRFSPKVRFPKISALVRLWFRLAKSVFVPGVLVGCRFWLFVVLASPVFVIVKIKVVCKSWACLRCRLFSAVVLVSRQATQQSVHPTLGIRRHFQAFSYASAFFQSDGVPPPAPARVTQTVRRLRIIL